MGKYPSILRWIYGLLHDWNAIQSFLSILSLLLRSTLIVVNEDYKGSTSLILSHLSPNSEPPLHRAISLGT